MAEYVFKQSGHFNVKQGREWFTDIEGYSTHFISCIRTAV